MDSVNRMRAQRLRLKAKRTNSSKDMERTLPKQATHEGTTPLDQLVRSCMSIQQACGMSEKKRRIKTFLDDLSSQDDLVIRSLANVMGGQTMRTLMNMVAKGSHAKLYQRVDALLKENTPAVPAPAVVSEAAKKKKHKKKKKVTDESVLDRVAREVLADLDERPRLPITTELTPDTAMPHDLLDELNDDEERPTFTATFLPSVPEFNRPF